MKIRAEGVHKNFCLLGNFQLIFSMRTRRRAAAEKNFSFFRVSGKCTKCTNVAPGLLKKCDRQQNNGLFNIERQVKEGRLIYRLINQRILLL